jgi:hypothetical protein
MSPTPRLASWARATSLFVSTRATGEPPPGAAAATMVTITTQHDLRSIRDLPFCHACGRPIAAGERKDRDHIPPQSCFDKADRNPPLKLRSHVDCNNSSKLNDEKVGQLIAARRHQSLDITKTRLRVESIPGREPDQWLAALTNLDVDGAIRRWVGGFHAALYREPLLPGTPYTVTSPLPKGTLGDQGVRFHPVPPHHRPFVAAIKVNRRAGNVDSVTTNQGKLRYECVWARDDSHKGWLCIFALDLYDWISLGDVLNFEPRGCVGAYMLDVASPPTMASVATELLFTLPDNEPLNPFGH